MNKIFITSILIVILLSTSFTMHFVSADTGKKKVADFVDSKKDPTYYIKRYQNEPIYKSWFDKNYGLKYKSIYEAVGLSEPTKTTTTTITKTTDKAKTTKTETQSKVPSWIKDKALLFGQGKLSEDEFLKSIQFLVDNGITKSSSSSVKNNPTSQTTPQTQQSKPISSKSTTGTNSKILTNSNFAPVFSQPDLYQDNWTKLYGEISQDPTVTKEGTAIYFDLSQGGEYALDKKVVLISQNTKLNLKTEDCLLVEGKIIGYQESTLIFTGAPINFPLVNLEKFTPISCIEAKYPTETTITVNQSQTQGSLTVTVDKIELTKYHVRTYMKVENLGSDDRYFDAYAGKIIQNKKQYSMDIDSFMTNGLDDIESPIPGGVIEEGIVIFKQLPNKDSFQLIFNGDQVWNGEEWTQNKFIFDIKP